MPERTGPVTVYHCPLPDCGWEHADPPSGLDEPMGAPADIAGPGVFPVAVAQRLARTEETLRAHLSGHPLEDWVKALTAANDAKAQLRQLLEQALFLRMNGERPPGAPRDNPAAETWQDWDRRAEAFLRQIQPQGDGND